MLNCSSLFIDSWGLIICYKEESKSFINNYFSLKILKYFYLIFGYIRMYCLFKFHSSIWVETYDTAILELRLGAWQVILWSYSNTVITMAALRLFGVLSKVTSSNIKVLGIRGIFVTFICHDHYYVILINAMCLIILENLTGLSELDLGLVTQW